MATHSSILAWRISWTEEPGRWSMGSQRVRHDCVTSLFFFLSSFLPFFLSFLSFFLGSDSKGSACYEGVLGLIPGSGRFPGKENDNPLQYSCLGNPMDREAWWGIAHGVIRIGHALATKPPPPLTVEMQSEFLSMS